MLPLASTFAASFELLLPGNFLNIVWLSDNYLQQAEVFSLVF